MARRSTKLLRFENSIYRYDKTESSWSVDSVNNLRQETKVNVIDKGTHASCKHMSQKVNPILLRRGFLDYWDSTKYISFKETVISANSFYKEILLKEFLERTFKFFSLIFDKYTIKEINGSTYIELFFYQRKDLSKRDLLLLPVEQKRFGKVLKELSLDQTVNLNNYNPFFEQPASKNSGNRDKSLVLHHKNFIFYLENKISKIFNSTVHIKLVQRTSLLESANLMAQFFAFEVERSNANFKRALNETFKEIKDQKKIKGLRINCSGRLGKAPMAKMEWFKFGQVPLSRISAKLDYSYSTSLTKYGIIGTKIWLYLHDK